MDYNTDYYQILEVATNASKEQLKASYRRLAKLHHPDKNPGDSEAAARFQLIQVAYETLYNDIAKLVYDDLRKNRASDGRSSNGTAAKEAAGNNRTYQKTRKIIREKRIYVKGQIQVKFQGEPELMDAYTNGREQHYTIFPTETNAVIHQSGIFKQGTTKEYEKAYSSADLFAAPVVQPIQCTMHGAEEPEYYQLTIHDLKIKDPVIQHVTRHEELNFGELLGEFYGYIVHTYEEEVTENFTEYFGATGEVEIKENAGVQFSREQYFNKDGSHYWGEWRIRPENDSSIRSKARPSYSVRSKDNSHWKYIGWIIYLFLGLLLFPQLVVIVLCVLAIILLLSAAGSITGRLLRFAPLFIGILALCFIAVGIISILTTVPVVVKNSPTASPPVESHKTPMDNGNKDTLIRHLVQWKDYDSVAYIAELSILQSSVNTARETHQTFPVNNMGANGIGDIYGQLYYSDTGKLGYVYHAFDSIIRAKHLDEVQAAKMIVSCIQSLPYYLILDKSCEADYKDPFISSYLRNCERDCCLGDTRFGVQSPAEFIGDLKGDCDTRALVLFTILGRMGTDVALLTSQAYKHAVIAVHFKGQQNLSGLSLPVKGKNYFLWETTSMGPQPGEIPEAIGNLNNWTISLLHQQ